MCEIQIVGFCSHQPAYSVLKSDDNASASLLSCDAHCNEPAGRSFLSSWGEWNRSISHYLKWIEEDCAAAMCSKSLPVITCPQSTLQSAWTRYWKVILVLFKVCKIALNGAIVSILFHLRQLCPPVYWKCDSENWFWKLWLEWVTWNVLLTG